ncbi:MAG: hypothetical protein C4581_01790 [Nitrospiraceae bacterium]|nr:MAG: hypothetical protein C4581_01790 [Nitrospiraceae bacterium]
MIWIALTLVVSSLIVTAVINRRTKCAAKIPAQNTEDKVCPIIGLSVMLIGVTLMVGYIIVSSLGTLGTHLVEAIRVWMG